MPERQLALTGRPEIIFSGRGYKAADMNEDNRDDWEDVFNYEATLPRTITLGGLIERWAGKQIAGYHLDLEGISQLVRQTDQLPAYVLIRQIGFSNGNRTCSGKYISYPEMKQELTVDSGRDVVLFNLDDVEKFESDNFPTACTSFSQLYGVDKVQTNTTLDKEQVNDNQDKSDGLSNDAAPTSAALQADIKIPNSKTLGALYSFILTLAYEKGIDLSESGLQKNLVLTAKDLGLPLSKGFISETIKELADYENAHKG